MIDRAFSPEKQEDESIREWRQTPVSEVLRVRGVMTIVPSSSLMRGMCDRAIDLGGAGAQSGNSDTCAVRSTNHSVPTVSAATEPKPITQRA